ncbi:TPA: pyruvate kinase [Campylobacter jejuni]
MLKKTKIVATVGPASEKEEILRQMIINGVNVFRLNFSHGTHEYHKKNLDTIRRVAKELHTRIGILQDISGPKIRTGELKEPFELKKGDRLDFYRETILGEKIAQNHYKISINQKSILDMLKIDEYIYLYDGSIRAKVENIDDQKIKTIIENDGFLNSNKGINFPNTKINIDVITQKDKNDLLWGIKNEVDFLAISFVQNAHDIDEVREILAQNNAKISIFAKIEKFDAVENIDEIIKSSDGVMVARGDLGIEVPYYKVPNIQKEIIQKANNASKPVITATQMLFSLAKSKTATRAEISDVANAVLDGTDIDFASLGYNGKNPLDMNTDELQQLVSEDGFFGVENTANRIADFVIKGGGDDVEKLKKGLEGMKKGFEQAEKMWGGELPQISQDTIDAALKKVSDRIDELGGKTLDLQA